MKYIILFLLVLTTTSLYAQQQQEFIPAPISAYGNVLQYHYSQSQWYYRYIVENEYSYSDFGKSSDELLKTMMKVKPQIDNTKSILDVYRQEQYRNYQYQYSR